MINGGIGNWSKIEKKRVKKERNESKTGERMRRRKMWSLKGEKKERIGKKKGRIAVGVFFACIDERKRFDTEFKKI